MSSILVRKLHNMLSDTSKMTQFFFSIDMRDSRFTVIACLQVKLLRVFLCITLCYVFSYVFSVFMCLFLCVIGLSQ